MASKGKSGAEALEQVQPGTQGRADDREVKSPGLEDAVHKPGDDTVRSEVPGKDVEDRGEVDVPKVTDTNPDAEKVTFDSDEEAADGAPTEAGLSDEQIVYRRTANKNPEDPEDNWPLDGRYRRVFNVAVPRVSTGELAELDWSDDVHDAMHRANEVGVLQEALNKGLHPRGEARFDGPLGDVDKASGVQALVYSVEVVPASVEAPEDAALAYTPSAALVDMGGSTVPDAGPAGDDRS